MPTIELTPEQADVLAQVLNDYLSDLRMEIADTDLMDFRDKLKHKKAVLNQVLEMIHPSS